MKPSLLDPTLLYPTPPRTGPLYDARLSLAHTDPLLALAYFVEAVGACRAECCSVDPSKLATLAHRARRAVEAATGRPFRNELYPDPAVAKESANVDSTHRM